MEEQPVILLEARRFRVERRVQVTPAGKRLEREVVIHPGAVAIVPVLEDGRICLIRNFRIAVNQTLVEVPAGTLDPGEAPADTAYRELIEETGYRAEKIEKLCELLMSPGILNERMHVYVATGLTAGETALETGEEIEPLVLPLDEALARIQSGEIQDAKSVAALLFYSAFTKNAE